MIPLKRVDHISMGAADWRSQSEKLQRLLGFRFLHAFPGSGPDDFSGCVSQVPGTGIEFEVIAPNGPRSFVQRFLDDNGPGLHHITLEVHDIHETCRELERLGIEPFGGVDDDGSWHVTYVHPKDSGGVLWQLFVPKRTPEAIDRSTHGGGVCGVKRVDHVSVAVPNAEWMIEFQSRVFGFELLRRWDDRALGYGGAIMAIPGSLLQFEIIEPAGPGSFVRKYLDTKRAGMHHICCEVESVDACVAALRGEGIEPFGGVVESDWRRHTFIHPRDSGGVLFQLFED